MKMIDSYKITNPIVFDRKAEQKGLVFNNIEICEQHPVNCFI